MKVGVMKKLNLLILAGVNSCVHSADTPKEERIFRGVQNGKKCAFTMAEVLITLGIIGIVAAMTLPVVIGNSKKVETSSRLKKFNSIMRQAIMMSELNNGEMTEWVRDGWEQRDEEGNIDYDANGQITKKFFTSYLAPYFKYTNIIDGKNAEVDEDGNIISDPTKTSVYLVDGSKITFHNGNCLDIKFDINGDTKPNISGRDEYTFLICTDSSQRLRFCGDENKAFCTYGGETITTRDMAWQKCKDAPHYCSRLLEMDNWEFKDDYPYKL